MSTYHRNTIYLHILKWPGETISLPDIPAKVWQATALTGGEAHFKQSAQHIEIVIPEASHNAMGTIIKLELDSSANNIPLNQWSHARSLP